MNAKFVPDMQKYISIFFFLLLLLLSGGCVKNDAQREFEQEAYSVPNNFTETTYQNEVISVDEDDWRTSPIFQGLVNIIPPYPNPANTDELIQFHVDVTGVQSINGLEVLIRFDDGSFRSLYDNFETLHTGYNDFRINPAEFSQFGSIEEAQGLHRVFIYNGNQQLISYGDVMVER